MADIVPDKMYALLHHDDYAEWLSGYEDVSWDKDRAYFAYSMQGKRGITLPIPSDDAWQAFLERIEEIGVFSWQSIRNPDEERLRLTLLDYEPRIWKIKIKRPDKKLFEREGPIDKLPPNFDKFCEALSELMGGQKFGVDA